MGKHIIVHGRVQNVGYRYFVKRNADLMQIRGYVRNLANGDVEVAAAGAAGNMEEFIEILRSGPSASEVKKLFIRELDSSELDLNSFSIRL